MPTARQSDSHHKAQIALKLPALRAKARRRRILRRGVTISASLAALAALVAVPLEFSSQNKAHNTTINVQATPTTEIGTSPTKPVFPSPPLGADVGEAALVSSDAGWALVHNQLFWTMDDGQAWSNITPPLPSNSSTASVVRAVAFVNASVGWVVAETLSPSSTTPSASLVIYSTSNDGANWTSSLIDSNVDPAAETFPANISFDGPNGWVFAKAATSSNSNIGTLYATTDNGTTWTNETAANANEIQPPVYGEVLRTGPTSGYLVGGLVSDNVYVTSDAGQTWAELSAPLPSGDRSCQLSLQTPVATDGAVVISGEETSSSSCEKDVLFSSTGIGSSAALQNRTVGAVEGPMSIIDANHWVIVASNGSMTETTADGGTTWSEVQGASFPYGGSGVAASFTSATIGWVVVALGTGNGLFATSDGGHSWGQLTP